jgi:thioesterase domain-containing protein
MSAIEAHRHLSSPIVRDALAEVREFETLAKPHGKMQDAAMKTPARTSTDKAHAALWTGILGAAKHLGKREPLPVIQRPTVVQLRQGTSAIPVYFIGAGLFEFHLAQLIPSNHSIFAIEIAWPSQWHDAATNNDAHASPTLEQMVAPYVAALWTHVGSAPCVLVGYSFHGSMAFEAAHQLRALGGKVETVMLLDAPAVYPDWHRAAWQNLKKVWKRTTDLSLATRLKTSWSISRWAFIQIGKVLKRGLLQMAMRVPGKLTTKLDTLGRPMQWQMIQRLYETSLRSYCLRRVDSQGVVFRADRKDDCPSPTVDYSLGWADLFSGGLEIIQVTGDHETMMRQRPHDLSLAREISRLLDQTDAAPTQRGLGSAAYATAPGR